MSDSGHNIPEDESGERPSAEADDSRPFPAIPESELGASVQSDETVAPPPELPANEEAQRFDQHLYVPLAPLVARASPEPRPGPKLSQAHVDHVRAESNLGFGVLVAVLSLTAVAGSVYFFVRSSFHTPEHREPGIAFLVPLVFISISALVLALSLRVLRLLAGLAAAAALLMIAYVFIGGQRQFNTASLISPASPKVPSPAPATIPLAAAPSPRTASSAPILPVRQNLPPGAAPVLLPPIVASPATAPALPLRVAGAFRFPQSTARVLADTPSIRLSAASDAKWLYVQAIFWADTSADESKDGETPHDYSTLLIDADDSGTDTNFVDRQYYLNPFPYLPGLHYTESIGVQRTTPITSDTSGRGAIRWVRDTDARMVRVDSFLVPLTEIPRRPGHGIRLGVYLNSENPPIVMSAPPPHVAPGRQKACTYDVPSSQFMPYNVDGKSRIELAFVPDDNGILPHIETVNQRMKTMVKAPFYMWPDRDTTNDLELSSQQMPAPMPEVPDQPEPAVLTDTSENIRRNGAFGFPQATARVLGESFGIRVSIASDAKYLYLQAVHFENSSASLAQRISSKDRASLSLVRAPYNRFTDIQYLLNQFYDARGLVMTVPAPEWRGSRGGVRRRDSEGRGSIRWARSDSGSLIRIDSFLLPLSEMDCKPGDFIRPLLYRYTNYINQDTPAGTEFLARRSAHWNDVLLGAPPALYRLDANDMIQAGLVPDDYPDQTSQSVPESDPATYGELHSYILSGMARLYKQRRPSNSFPLSPNGQSFY